MAAAWAMAATRRPRRVIFARCILADEIVDSMPGAFQDACLSTTIAEHSHSAGRQASYVTIRFLVSCSWDSTGFLCPSTLYRISSGPELHRCLRNVRTESDGYGFTNRIAHPRTVQYQTSSSQPMTTRQFRGL